MFFLSQKKSFKNVNQKIEKFRSRISIEKCTAVKNLYIALLNDLIFKKNRDIEQEFNFVGSSKAKAKLKDDNKIQSRNQFWLKKQFLELYEIMSVRNCNSLEALIKMCQSIPPMDDEMKELEEYDETEFIQL